ncbi:type II toxin-antitoxin system Phd/YefM family antitoxin [Aliidiomarina indica]|uniref:type II toxin-antitoxin system Phd/YefM family antitoxin n=1 Tax=Aliidiomarina indica TaxID=2749147 RepID=UPI001E42E7CB|nr:type II toxin-antitoxin system Phd/YefM family antitoxin [Aliidiomarina indica]
MQIKTISYIKQHAANLNVEEPIVVTQGGTPVYRIESEKNAQLRDEGIALLKLVNIAERDVLGVTDYRQLTYQDDKILFRFDETTSTVYVMAFLRQRHSAQQLLIDYVIQADI